MSSIFLTDKAACLTHPVFSSLGTTWCRNTRSNRKSLLAHRVLAQKNIFIQAQHLPPIYYWVIFLMRSWFLLFSWYGLADPQCGERCSAKSNLELFCWNVFQSDIPGMRRWHRGTVLPVRASPFGATLLARGNCPDWWLLSSVIWSSVFKC